jgi:hypothetical protein
VGAAGLGEHRAGRSDGHLASPSAAGAHYQKLRAAYADLPDDPYARGSGRYRRYARGMFLPWTGEFTWIPSAGGPAGEGMNGYFQGEHNPEYMGVIRELPAISDDILANPLLVDIIRFDFQQTRWNRATPYGRCTSAST